MKVTNFVVTYKLPVTEHLKERQIGVITEIDTEAGESIGKGKVNFIVLPLVLDKINQVARIGGIYKSNLKSGITQYKLYIKAENYEQLLVLETILKGQPYYEHVSYDLAIRAGNYEIKVRDKEPFIDFIERAKELKKVYEIYKSEFRQYLHVYGSEGIQGLRTSWLEEDA